MPFNSKLVSLTSQIFNFARKCLMIGHYHKHCCMVYILNNELLVKLSLENQCWCYKFSTTCDIKISVQKIFGYFKDCCDNTLWLLSSDITVMTWCKLSSWSLICFILCGDMCLKLQHKLFTNLTSFECVCTCLKWDQFLTG